MPPAHRTGTCRSDDVTLAYRRFGRPGRAPILVAHGLWYFSYDWIDVAGALAADREVVAMDLRGFGDSTWSAARDYSVQTMGADIVALLDHLDWRKAVLIGHSMGGRNASHCAAKNRARRARDAVLRSGGGRGVAREDAARRRSARAGVTAASASI